MKDKELREEFEPIVEITKRIAQIAGILNGSAVHDTGQTVVAQQKLGEILGFLDQALKAKEEEVVGRVAKAFYEEIDEPYTKERMVSLPERFAKRLFSLKKGETK